MLVRVDGVLPHMTGVEGVAQRNGAFKLTLAADTTPQHILGQLLHNQTTVEHFEIAIPTLDEVFIRAVSEKAGSQGGPAWQKRG